RSRSRSRRPVMREGSTTGSWASRDVERLTHRERLCVQGLADDRALHPVRDQLAQRAQVLEGGDPAGGDDLRLRARAHLPQQVQVRAAQGAVLGDVRDDVALAAGLVVPLEGLPDVASLAGAAPSGEGDPAHAEADADAVAGLGEDLRGPLRVLERGGAEVDASAPGGQGPGEGFVVADPAGELDVHLD